MSVLFGTSGNPEEFYNSGGKSTLQAMKWLKQYGLDAYEYQAGNGLNASEATLAAIGDEARLRGIRLSIHAPYFISLSSDDEEIKKRSIQHITTCLSGARALGAEIIVVHPGSAGKDRTAAFERVKHMLEEILALTADEFGDIPIGLETMGKFGQLGTFDEVLELCGLDRRLRPVVDFGHLYARSLGERFNREDDYKSAFDKIADVLSADEAKRLHCHFSKIMYTKSGEKCHSTFADECFGPAFEPFVNFIAKEGLSPRVICESKGTQAKDALSMKKYYESIIR